MRRTSIAGFTLTEMLVALFITGMVSAAGATLLVNASQSGKRLETFGDQLRGLEVGQALIRNDFAALVPLTFDPGDEFGVFGGLAWRPIQTTGPVMQFYRNGWLHSEDVPVQSDIQAVEYALENGALLRKVHLPGERRNSVPVRQLFGDVARVDMRTFENGVWRDAPRENPFGELLWPELIEMTIVFEDAREFRIIGLSGARK